MYLVIYDFPGENLYYYINNNVDTKQHLIIHLDSGHILGKFMHKVNLAKGMCSLY